METIKVDFIKMERLGLFKPITYQRVQFEENYNASMLPQKGTYIVIGDKTYIVRQLVYFPFGDKEGQIGVKVYLEE